MCVVSVGVVTVGVLLFWILSYAGVGESMLAGLCVDGGRTSSTWALRLFTLQEFLPFRASAPRCNVMAVAVDALWRCVRCFARFFWCMCISTSHTPDVAVVPGSMAELVTLYWVVPLLILGDSDPDVTDAFRFLTS